jgi:dTDP-4-amino-4,6-dideoxygalactose transaminase
MIPFVDLNAQYISIKGEVDTAIQECINEGNFIKGKAVYEFEKAFADYLGADYCLGCGNGTDALEIILSSLHIGPGDEVIVPALTWISTAEAVSNIGAEPVFVDVNNDTYSIDHRKIEENISIKTKAIIPVHLYGSPAAMKEINEIADKYGLFVIEDCAQAHGAHYNGVKVGTLGIAAAFSFFPSKNLGAYGDGGAIVTSNKELYETARMISNHGQLKTKHDHAIIGRNSRLDSLQAAVLKVKLPHLDEWNSRRKVIADFYKKQLLINEEIILPILSVNADHVFHLFVIRHKNRKQIASALDEKEISWAVHYPKPLPFIEAYKYKRHQQSEFPVSCKLTSEIISLPMYPELTESQVSLICGQILKKHQTGYVR